MSHNAWHIDPAAFPSNGTLTEKIEFWLRYAVLAPSAHNTQPWDVRIESDAVVVLRNPEFTLTHGDPTLRETFLGLGAFIETFRIAAAHWDYHVMVEKLSFVTSDKEVATLKLTPGKPDEFRKTLFPGITQRHTNRGYYEPTISDEVLSQLKMPSAEGATITLITESEARERIAALVGKGTRIALAMPDMVEELGEYVFVTDPANNTGMTLSSMVEEPPQVSSGAEWVTQSLDPEKEGAYWEDTFKTSPLHVVIATAHDGPEAWLTAGSLLQQIALTAAINNLTHCISAAPVEVPTLSPLLRKEIDPEYRPQVLMRIGTPRNPAFTQTSPRRPIR